MGGLPWAVNVKPLRGIFVIGSIFFACTLHSNDCVRYHRHRADAGRSPPKRTDAPFEKTVHPFNDGGTIIAVIFRTGLEAHPKATTPRFEESTLRHNRDGSA